MLAHLTFCVLAREGPRDAAAFGVTARLPSGGFGGEQYAVGQAPVKALAVKAADLDSRPVELVRRRGLGRASLGVATNLPSAGKPAPTSPRPRAVKDADLDFHHVEPVRGRGPGRASLSVATNLPSAGKPAPTSPRPRALRSARRRISRARARFSACTQTYGSRYYRRRRQMRTEGSSGSGETVNPTPAASRSIGLFAASTKPSISSSPRRFAASMSAVRSVRPSPALP